MRYDYEKDQQSIEQTKPKHGQLKEFDDDYSISKVAAELHEITYQVKDQSSALKKMQRQLDIRVTQSQLVETIALINAGIHTDPNIIKLLKTKEDLREQQENKLKMNAGLFSRKLNQMSESLSVLLSSIKRLQSKVASVEDDLNMQLNQKSNSIQLQLEQVRGDTNKESMELNQKMQLLTFELTDKMREIDTKLNWKLNEFKTKIDDKINQEMVLIYLENMEKKMDKNMRDFQIKSDIDPQRVDRIEAEIDKNRISGQNKITECNFVIHNIKKEMEQNLVKIQDYSINKINIQKRLNLFNDNFMDVYKRVIKCETEEVAMQQNISKLLIDDTYALEELKRINKVLLNIKISDDFQRMLEEMNPSKVLQLQTSVDQVKSQQISIFREIAIAKREVAIISAKSENMGFLMPNKERDKLKKEEINQALNNFLIDNQFAQKISNLDKQVSNYKDSMDSISILSRQVARLQKESDYHTLSFQLKSLEQYFKKELTLMNNRIKQRNSPFQYNSIVDRPGSQSRSIITDQPIGQASISRSFSTKKVTHLPKNAAQQISRQIIESKMFKQRC